MPSALEIIVCAASFRHLRSIGWTYHRQYGISTSIDAFGA
jgi:hypothetical protein